MGKISALPVTQGKPLPPPKDLGANAKTVWKHVVAGYSADHFKAGDIPLLRAFCEAADLHARATAHCVEHGEVIEVPTKNGTFLLVSPWLKIAERAAATMASLATKLRICANSRLSLKQAANEKVSPTANARAGLMFGG